MKLLGEKVLIDKPEYFFVVEEFADEAGDQMLFMHLKVNHWTPSVAKEVFRNWKLFRRCVTCPVFAVSADDDTPKWVKFVSWLGFQFHIQGICEDGKQRLCFVHYNEKNNERTIVAKHHAADLGDFKHHQRV